MSILACIIPHRYIDTNIRESMEILNSEGRFPMIKNIPLYGKDNITDGSMYNIAISGYDMSYFEEAIMNPWSYSYNDKIHTAEYGLRTLNTQNGTIERQSYGRYWHGYQVPLRILSIFFNIREQRIFHCILLWSIFLLLTYVIYLKLGKFVSIGWFLTLLICGFPVVPLSLQYIGCYYITFISVFIILLKPKFSSNFILFFIIGGLTSYIDFLTVPLITLCIPAIFSCLLNNKNLTWRCLFLIIIFWGLGYVSIWASKWIIQFLYLGNDALNMVIHAGEAHTIIPFLPAGINHKYFLITCELLSIVLLVDISIYLSKKNKTSQVKKLFFISIIPFVWYFVFLGHNVCHIWFTYRSLTTTIYCCWLILFSKKIKL